MALSLLCREALAQGDALLGFVVLDPYRTASGEPGHLLNLFRIGPTRLWGVYAATVVALTEQLQAEGARELSLGFVPLAPEPRAPERAWWSRPQLALLRVLASRSGYLRGLLRMKSAFAVRQVPRYVLSRRRFLLPDVQAIVDAMGVRG